MREIEVKLRVPDLKELEQKLVERECTLSEPIHQHDFIYSNKGDDEIWRAATAGHITLRLRKQDNDCEFNLKQQRSSESDNIEYETKVEDPEEMHNIILALGFVPGVEVKKIRRKGKLGEYEICLDEVEELGNFVELEKLANEDADPITVREELFRELETLGLSRTMEETRGYDTQIYHLTITQK